MTGLVEGPCFDLSLRIFQNHPNMTGVLLLGFFFVVVLFTCLCLLIRLNGCYLKFGNFSLMDLPKKSTRRLTLYLTLLSFFPWFYFEPTCILAFLLGHWFSDQMFVKRLLKWFSTMRPDQINYFVKVWGRRGFRCF